jgi:hypothetical protein
MFEEYIVTGSEQGSKQINGPFRLDIKKLSSKNNLIEDPIHKGLINGLKNLFQTKLLSLLIGHIIQNDIRGPE